jgi:hypothetical protein
VKYAIRKEGRPAGSAGSAGRQQRGQIGCAGNTERKQAALAVYGHKGRQAQADKERRGGSGASVSVGRVLQGSGRSTDLDTLKAEKAI